MPLEFQQIQAPFRFGLAEGVDPHQVPFGTLVTAENVEWSKSGRLQKRNGITALGTIGATGLRLFTRGSELCAATHTTLYSRSTATSSWEATDGGGFIPNVGLTWSTLGDTFDGAQAADIGITSAGLLVHAWVSGDPFNGVTATGQLFYQIIDSTTGTVITPPARLGTSDTPERVRVLTSTTNYIIVWDTGTNIKCSVNGGAVATLRNDAAANASFDACIIGTEFVIAYNLGAGGIALYRYSIATTPVQQATGTVTGESSTVAAISIDGASGETLFIGYFGTSGADSFRIACANPSTLVQTLAPTVVDASALAVPSCAVKRLDATSCVYAYSATGNAAGDPYQDGVTITKKITNAGVISATRKTFYTQLLSRPFIVGTNAYAFVTNFSLASGFDSYDTFTGADSYLIKIETTTGADNWPHQLVGHVDVLVSGYWKSQHVTNVATITSDSSGIEVATTTPFASVVPTTAFERRQGCRLVRAKLQGKLPRDTWRGVELGGETYLAAGVLTAYDGRQAFDFGFAHAPWMDTVSTAPSAAGGNMATGNYIYSFVPEYRSSAGVLHRGPPSIAKTIAVTGPTGSVDLRIAPVNLSHKSPSSQATLSTEPQPVLQAVYRTIVNKSIPQRLTSEPAYSTVFQRGTASAPLQLVDTYIDTNIGHSLLKLAKRPAIYTASGELDDFQPSGCTTIAQHRNRLWIVAGDEKTVWFSKDFSLNPGIAPGFHPNAALVFDEPIKALFSLDEKLIMWSETSIWYLLGAGPAPNGQGSDYEAYEISTDLGCVNPRSVVGTPDGVMFEASRGLYLLTRGLELIFIGKPIQDQLTAYPYITSAVHVPSKSQIRFTCNNAEPHSATASTVLVYDYSEKQWTTFRYSISGTSYPPIADAILWNDTYTLLMVSGKVFQEDATTYLDDGSTWVPLTLETAWVCADGPLGFVSVRLFNVEGISHTNHDLTISVGFDNDTSYPQTRSFAAGSSVTSIGPLEECEITIGTRRKCSAIRFKIQDATPTNPGTYPVSTGRGPSFDMLGIEIGVKRGRNMPATKKG